MRRLTRSLRCFVPASRGSSSVEFAILSWPVLALIMACLQLGIFQYTQLILSNTLFDTAAAPPASVLAGQQAVYASAVCDKLPFMTRQTCTKKLLVEMFPLSMMPATPQAVEGVGFLPGKSMNVMLLRASIPTVRLLPLLPDAWAQASVVFRRP